MTIKCLYILQTVRNIHSNTHILSLHICHMTSVVVGWYYRTVQTCEQRSTCMYMPHDHCCSQLELPHCTDMWTEEYTHTYATWPGLVLPHCTAVQSIALDKMYTLHLSPHKFPHFSVRVISINKQQRINSHSINNLPDPFRNFLSSPTLLRAQGRWGVGNRG